LLRYSATNDLVVMEALLARIHVAERMNAGPVDDAARMMLAKHGAMMRQLGYWTTAQFRAALLLERAATSFYAGRYVSALGCLAESLVRYPLKPAAFFGQLPRRAFLVARAAREANGRAQEVGQGFSPMTRSRALRPQPSKPEA
jgi:hypothetical protein